MKRRAARDARASEEPSLTRTATPSHLTEGTLIIIDLDKMEEIIKERGWSEYKPNPATGLLTMLVEEFSRQHRAVVVYGLDEKRGTEEAILEIPMVEPGEIAEDLVKIADTICKEANVSVTIVAVTSIVGSKPARTRRDAYTGIRGEARKILTMLKRKGGGVVYIDGSIMYTSPCRRTSHPEP
ncbi:MAG: hypothetical protein F7B19_01285 [Desulfurococcales archaeon]|nr:hypothetical protein [Desulfurococcales archaeon]